MSFPVGDIYFWHGRKILIKYALGISVLTLVSVDSCDVFTRQQNRLGNGTEYVSVHWFLAEDPMDHTSSRDSDSPRIKRIPEKPPFKLCFSKDQLLGKSSVRTLRMNCDSIAPKFYSRECELANNQGESDAIAEITSGGRKSSTDTNCYPYRLTLTSHTYGWWHEQGIQPKDSRFNFHKKTSDLVHFQMKVYAEDRRLGVSKY